VPGIPPARSGAVEQRIEEGADEGECLIESSSLLPNWALRPSSFASTYTFMPDGRSKSLASPRLAKGNDSGRLELDGRAYKILAVFCWAS
jgi:hypothetical protein